MTKHIALPLLSLGVLLTLAPVSVAAQGYDLPPAPTPTSSPVYGPQDPERPRSRPTPQPSATPTATPSRAPAPQPTASGTPTPRQGPVVQPVPTTRATRRPLEGRTPAPEQVPAQVPAQAPGATNAASPDPTGTNLTPSVSATPPSAAPGPAATSAASEAVADGSGPPWGWIALAALLAVLAGAFAWWRKRSVAGPSAAVPQIERPEPVAKKTTVTVPASETAPAALAKLASLASARQAEAIAFHNGPLHVAFETRTVTVTMMNATLAYRITLSNRGTEPLSQIMVGGAMEAANDRSPIERQLEPPLGQLPLSHQLDTLEPGAVQVLTGEIRVPLAQLKPIIRDGAQLFMPIARVRAAGTPPGGDPLVSQRSVLLGLTDQGPQLGPIRLDAGPRVYAAIGQRLVEPQAA